MTEFEFNNSNNIAKVDYVISMLQDAYKHFQLIYDSGLGVSDETIAELEYIGNDLARIGVMAEELDFANVYSDLQANLSKLNNISSVISNYIISTHLVN